MAFVFLVSLLLKVCLCSEVIEYGDGVCNATFSPNSSTCANSHPFLVNINGGCQPSDVEKGCWFIYNCICNGTVSGYQFSGYRDWRCKGEVVAVHTLPIDTCTPDHSACDGDNAPNHGYAYLESDQFKLCCPDCSQESGDSNL